MTNRCVDRGYEQCYSMIPSITPYFFLLLYRIHTPLLIAKKKKKKKKLLKKNEVRNIYIFSNDHLLSPFHLSHALALVSGLDLVLCVGLDLYSNDPLPHEYLSNARLTL